MFNFNHEAWTRISKVKRLTILVCCVVGLFAVVSSVWLVAAQQRNAKQQETPTSVVRARVIYDDSGQPVRRARVQFIELGAASRRNVSAATNSNGELIAQIKAGEYFVLVDSPGVIAMASFDSTDREPNPDEVRREFQTFTFDGVSERSIEIRARRGGAITGRIAYQDGSAAVNTTIEILRRNAETKKYARIVTGIGEASSIVSMLTDDRGIYRVAGLPPGEYIVAASEKNTRRATDDDEREMLGWLSGLLGSDALMKVFYGGATKSLDASVIQVAAGAEMSGIDITFPITQTFALSGKVIARSNRKAVKDVGLYLRSVENDASPYGERISKSLSHHAQSDDSGAWSFEEVPVGEYVLQIEPPTEYETSSMSNMNMNGNMNTMSNMNGMSNMNMASPKPRRRYAPQEVKIKVTESGIEPLTVELASGGRVSGTVVIEGGKLLPSYMSVKVVDAENAIDTDEYSSGYELRSSQVNERRSFEIEGLAAGDYFIVPSVGSTYQTGEEKSKSAVKYYVKSIASSDGRDLRREPLTLADSADIKDVRVTIGTDGAVLTGRAMQTPRGSDKQTPEPARGAMVLILPADEKLWRNKSLYVTATSDTDGKFKVVLPPGEHLAILYRFGMYDLRLASAADIKQLAGRGERLTLAPNATLEHEFRLSQK